MKKYQNNLTYQYLFLKKVKEKINSNKSFIDEIAHVLNINYDAAYRRVNNKVLFNLEEVVIIAKKFGVSLDKMIVEQEQNHYITYENEASINSIQSLEGYINEMMIRMARFKNSKKVNFQYFSSSLPLYFLYGNPVLFKYKFYLWYFYSNFNKPTSIKKYKDIKVSEYSIDLAKSAHDIYYSLKVKEIWKSNALKSFLRQLQYLMKIKLLNPHDVEEIVLALHQEFKWLESFLIEQVENKEINFNLYKNELVISNDSLLVDYNGLRTFVFLYKVMKFNIIRDKKACDQNYEHFLNHLNYSTEISGYNSLVRNEFFSSNFDTLNKAQKVLEYQKFNDLDF